MDSRRLIVSGGEGQGQVSLSRRFPSSLSQTGRKPNATSNDRAARLQPSTSGRRRKPTRAVCCGAQGLAGALVQGSVVRRWEEPCRHGWPSMSRNQAWNCAKRI